MANNEIDPKNLRAFYQYTLLSGVLERCPETKAKIEGAVQALSGQTVEVDFAFFEKQLAENVWLMNPSTETLLMETIDILKGRKH